MFSKQLGIVVLAVLTTLASCGLKQELDKKEKSSSIFNKKSETQFLLDRWQDIQAKNQNIFSTLKVEEQTYQKILLKTYTAIIVVAEYDSHRYKDLVSPAYGLQKKIHNNGQPV
ncbi:hypothetical protein STA3757_40370 [Stanieria sp. NIES-3757]|nr:hypothetical protein STA3757_40370 [Stanieria sp. NIES-3757]